MSSPSPFRPPFQHPHPTRRAPPLPLGTSGTCEVCCERVAVSELWGCRECYPNGVDLPGRYCRTCMATHWHSLIFSGSHSRIVCMCGGAVSDEDVAAICPPRTFARMRYFRSRDAHKDAPHVRWCPRDGCWALIAAPPAANETHVDCPECHTRVCYKCEAEDAPGHRCPPKILNSAATVDTAVFGAWAFLHTKSCPSCSARIQKAAGCSHLTCSRCAAYFCWRCKGYLHSGDTLQGRPCVCDKAMTVAVQAGLLTVCVIGSPIWVTAAVLGAGPYAVYRWNRRRKTKARPNERTGERMRQVDFESVLGASPHAERHRRLSM